jgi:HSP20 family molecular chaperone IbpA
MSIAKQRQQHRRNKKMFDMMKPLATWDDMWQNMIALAEYPLNGKTLKDIGLRKLISRPHNLINVKDKDGNVIAQKLEVVTTPFKKDDVKLSVKGNVLTIECGSMNVVQNAETPDSQDGIEVADEMKEVTEDQELVSTDDYIYKGISTQSYTFSLKLGENIDKGAIKAKNQDGVLTVTLPYKKGELPEVTQIRVE